MGKITSQELSDTLSKDINQISNISKEVANLNLNLEASKRVVNGTTFGSDFTTSASMGMLIDYRKTTSTEALTAGTTVLYSPTVQRVKDKVFDIGNKVTVLDDLNKEEVTITRAETVQEQFYLECSPLVNSYKEKALIARTTAIYDTVAKALRFGGWDNSTTTTVTDATVVASAYDTSGNGGRKLVKIGQYLVSALFDSTNARLKYYKSIDGINWTKLAFDDSFSGGSFTLSPISDTRFIVVRTVGTTTLTHTLLDVDSGSRISFVDIDNGQSGFNGISLDINSAGTELHATWSSKNATYPNSFNIRYAKGTINADGSVTWGAVEQLTKFNTTGDDAKNPSISLSNYLSIAVEYSSSSFKWMCNLSTNPSIASNFGTGSLGANWKMNIIYDGGSYIQSSPSAIFVPQSVNGLANGRIWVTWHGGDGIQTIAQIRVAYSDDGGVTWSTMEKLTSGSQQQRFASLTANKNGDVFVVWHGRIEQPNGVSYMKFDGVWNNPVIIGTNELYYYPSALFDPTYDLDFSGPLFIYQHDTIKVGFYGTWTTGSTVLLLDNDVRGTIEKPTDGVVAWVSKTNHESGLTGTVEVLSSNLTSITGTSTLFTTELSVGDWIGVGGEYRQVSSILSDTTLTVNSQFIQPKSVGSTLTKQTFVLDAELNANVMDKFSIGVEDRFSFNLPEVHINPEIKINMRRENLSDDVNITKILGGVA